jgi:hypothetical protein
VASKRDILRDKLSFKVVEDIAAPGAFDGVVGKGDFGAVVRVLFLNALVSLFSSCAHFLTSGLDEWTDAVE